MNTFDKLIKYCRGNNIPAELSTMHNNCGRCINIWIASNDYYQIIDFFLDAYQIKHGIKKRVRISNEVFDTELYKANGEAYYGSYSNGISYKNLINGLEYHFKRG